MGKYTHDVDCVVEGPLKRKKLCDDTYLDGYNGKEHKSGWRTVTKEKNPHLNSSAAEQLWAKTERLQKTKNRHSSVPGIRVS